MSTASLKKYFSAVVAKRLSEVEVNPQRSHQHEFNGTQALKGILGLERRTQIATLLYLSDEEELVRAQCKLTWYDAREADPVRSEHRLYFQHNEVIDSANADDLLILAIRPSGDILIAIATEGSTREQQLQWLFGVEPERDKPFTVSAIPEHQIPGALLLQSEILQLLGIDDTAEWVTDRNQRIVDRRVPDLLPSTREFSILARDTLLEPPEDPDELLVSWMQHEEALFRTYEQREVSERLSDGFTDVDEFVSCALGILNRRKSRAGQALEHHFEELLIRQQIRYTRGGRTERKSRPDFLFPGESEYHDGNFPAQLLTFLGAKTSCKDRWRQILAEAERIERKHLLTLEPGISMTQTEEMQSQLVELVVLGPIQETYTEAQREHLRSVGAFLEMVKIKQSEGGLRCPP